MVGLAIHTSSPALGLALIDEATGDRVQTWPLGRDLTSRLHDCLQAFITPYTWQDLVFLAVAQGPGGFTGTRIGIVVARTLAQQLEIPLFGVSSLAAIAQHHRLHHPDFPDTLDIAVEMRAQRDERFGAIYRPAPTGLTAQLPDQARPQADWDACLAQWSQPYHHLKVEGDVSATVEGVLSLAQLRWQTGDRPHWSTVLPFYGQNPVDETAPLSPPHRIQIPK